MPNWREVIRAGRNATNSMVASYDEIITSPGSHIVTWFEDASKTTGDVSHWSGYRAAYEVDLPVPFSDLLDSTDAKARANFNAQFRKFSNAMSGGVFLGEMREALSMLRRPAASLSEGIGKYLGSVNKRSRSARNKPKPSVKEISKIAAESWLEYSFGWVPFVNDIQDAFKALDNLQKQPVSYKIAAGAQSESNTTDTTDYPTVFGYMASIRNVRKWHKTHIRYKGAVLIQPQVAAADYAKNWGVHTSQFVATAWELLPWSFLADYFANIGDILNYDNSINSKLLWACKGVRSDSFSSCTWTPDHDKTRILLGQWFVSSTGGSSFAIYKRSAIDRSSVTSVADLTLSDITVSLPTSTTQWINMSALLASANSIHAQRFNRF
jgi:hypothetical protein